MCVDLNQATEAPAISWQVASGDQEGLEQTCIVKPRRKAGSSFHRGRKSFCDAFSKNVGSLKKIYLHIVDTVALVHALVLRMQAIVLPLKALVFGGHELVARFN